MIIDTLTTALKNKFETEMRTGVHVSDIVLCPRRSAERRLNPQPLTMRELNFFTSGRAIGDIIAVLAKSDSGKWVAEHEVRFKNIVAHVDIYDSQNNIPIEVKSSRTKGLEKPKPFHIEQLKCYMAMLNADKGYLLYQFLMNFEDKPFGEFEVNMTKEEREAQLLKMEKQGENFELALKEKNPMVCADIFKNPDLNWLCKDCPLYEKCKGMQSK